MFQRGWVFTDETQYNTAVKKGCKRKKNSFFFLNIVLMGLNNHIFLKMQKYFMLLKNTQTCPAEINKNKASVFCTLGAFFFFFGGFDMVATFSAFSRQVHGLLKMKITTDEAQMNFH